MLHISLTLLVATFGVALVQLAQAWKAERAVATSRAVVVDARLAA
jgi:hypothetical protein